MAEMRECEKWRGELKQQTKDGSLVSITRRWVARPDKIPFVLQVNSDITELKRIQVELVGREAGPNSAVRLCVADPLSHAVLLRYRSLGKLTVSFRNAISGPTRMARKRQESA